MKGYEVITALKKHLSEKEIIVSSNGNISREVFHILLKPQVYLRGSMGLPISVGMGIALALPEKNIIVITGDGNFLMGLGSTITNAYYKLKNLKILILDNMKYYTTGGQETVSSAIDYSKFFDSLNIPFKKSLIASHEQIMKDLSDFLNSTVFSILHLKIEESKMDLENIPWHPEKITEKIATRLIF